MKRTNSLKLGLFVTAFKMSLGFIAYPLYLHYLSPTELSMYFLFISTGIIFELLDFNFSGTLSRYFAYSTNHNKLEVKNKSIKIYNPYDLLSFARKYYQIQAAISTIILVIGFSVYLYYFTLIHKIPFLKFELVWLFYSLSMVALGFFNYMSPLLIGFGHIDRLNKISFISRVSGFVVQVVLIVSGFGLITLACSAFISALIERLLMYATVSDLCRDFNRDLNSISDNFMSIFVEIWKTTYKLGLITLSWMLIAKLNSFVIGIAIKDITLLNQYLFTFQVITILMTLAHVPISNSYGDISSYYVSDEVKATNVFLKANKYSILIMVVLSSGMILFGNLFFSVIGIKHSLLPMKYIVLVVIIYLLEKQLVNHSTMISVRNEVPMLKSYLISGGLISITIVTLAILKIDNLWLFLLPQLIFQSVFNYWYWVRYNLSKSNVKIASYCRGLLSC